MSGIRMPKKRPESPEKSSSDIVDSYSTLARKDEREDCLWRRDCLSLAVKTGQRVLPCLGCKKYVKETQEMTTGLSSRSGWVF